MDKDYLYAAFMPFVIVVVAAAAVFFLFFFSDSQTSNANHWLFALIELLWLTGR